MNNKKLWEAIGLIQITCVVLATVWMAGGMVLAAVVMMGDVLR